MSGSFIFVYFLLLVRLCRMVSNSDTMNALKKPSTCTPCTNAVASIIIRVLMTNRNNPRVMTVIGIVSNCTSGFTIRFTRKRTSENTTRAVRELTWNPE